jgi:3-carboxy-cis,cis-muconate cycloisomerase
VTHRPIALVGPTATGKSDLALALARRLGPDRVEVVNADAMQLYRGMDIGTAKLPPPGREGVPHHLLDVLDVTETATVAAYQRDARAAVDAVLARGGVAAEVSDRAWLRAMLDVEAALARAEARTGLMSDDDASAIAAAAADTDAFDPAQIGADAAATGNPVVPLVRALTDAVPGSAAGEVHRGATSQDVLDSAAMLVAHRALGPLLGDLEAAADAAARLTEEQRGTVMAGRTLLQQALPVTFGLKAAEWLQGLDDAAARLDAVRRTRLAVQLGGAAGTLASLGDRGVDVLAGMAGALGLAEPVLPWHTIRTRPAELAAALGEACGVVAKVARDVALMAQTEVGEVAEGAGGGSSTVASAPSSRKTGGLPSFRWTSLAPRSTAC